MLGVGGEGGGEGDDWAPRGEGGGGRGAGKERESAYRVWRRLQLTDAHCCCVPATPNRVPRRPCRRPPTHRSIPRAASSYLSAS